MFTLSLSFAARLPFKILDCKGHSPVATSNESDSPSGQANKKRKLSDTSPLSHKAPKTPKNDENTPQNQSTLGRMANQKAVLAEAEHEVSSSSEAAETHTFLKNKNPSPKATPRPLGLLDKFVRTTQQLEVSTSGVESSPTEEPQVDLTSSDNEAEPMEVNSTDLNQRSSEPPEEVSKEDVAKEETAGVESVLQKAPENSCTDGEEEEEKEASTSKKPHVEKKVLPCGLSVTMIGV